MQRVVTMLALSLGALCGAAADEYRPLPFDVYVPHAHFSIYDGPEIPTFTVLNSEREWRRLWSLIEPKMGRDGSRSAPYELPAIDFYRSTLIVVAIGSRPSGGFRVELESVSESPLEILVRATELSPSADCVVTTSVTAPTRFALIPRTNKPVRFDVRKKVVDCSGNHAKQSSNKLLKTSCEDARA
jgi:hypothetical protein